LRKLARRSVEDFDSICDALLGIDHKPGIGSALRAAPLAVTITVEHVDRGALTTLSVSGAEDVCAEVAGGVIDKETRCRRSIALMRCCIGDRGASREAGRSCRGPPCRGRPQTTASCVGRLEPTRNRRAGE